jgi:hypothetical protein
MMKSTDLLRDPKELCLDLLRAESEEEVTKILQANNLLDDSLWRDLGDDENNFSIVGNQQSSPAAALIEKIINSIDAVLMAHCLIAGTDPESPDAPQSMNEAVERFLGVKNGSLANLTSRERSKLAEESIWMLATGSFERPCYSFIDFGEGQTPKKMPETFLSLFRKSRKIRMPFVQGRFQMGGTGVLPYCGKHKYQLIISRRHPEIARTEIRDNSADLWGFTVVRRVPREGLRSSVYRYLAPQGEILSFESTSLPFLPGNGGKPYVEPAEWGTCIKLYNYQFDIAALKTNIKFDLSRELDRHLISIPIPVRLCECRRYRQESPYATLAGMEVRLKDNRAKALETQFPTSALLNVRGLGEIPLQVFLFRRRAGRRFLAKKSAIAFTINGQTHGTFSSSFFLRQTVQLDYLRDDLLMIADCTNIPGMSRDDLFMSSRDRLRENPIKKMLEEQLELLLRNHRGLQDMNKQRELEASQESLKDNRLLQKLLDRMISFTPSLASFFSSGNRLTSPHMNGGQNPNYVGKKFPTYFRLLNEPEGGLVKECPVNAKCAVVFETDAENQYFKRASDSGKLIVAPNEVKVGMLLWNGRGVLFLHIPSGIKPNTMIDVTSKITDYENETPFVSRFKLKATALAKKVQSTRRRMKRKKKTRQLALPNIVKVRKNMWREYDFDMGSGLTVKGSTIFVNVDNVYLVTEKSRSRAHPLILEEQFTNGLVIASLAMRHDYNERLKRGQIKLEEAQIRERIEESSRGLAAVILPMIQQLDVMKIKRGILRS